MLMDLFYKTAKMDKKRRVHFNSFMLDVHKSKKLIENLACRIQYY